MYPPYVRMYIGAYTYVYYLYAHVYVCTYIFCLQCIQYLTYALDELILYSRTTYSKSLLCLFFASSYGTGFYIGDVGLLAGAIRLLGRTIFNPLCFLQFEDPTVPPTKWDNVRMYAYTHCVYLNVLYLLIPHVRTILKGGITLSYKYIRNCAVAINQLIDQSINFRVISHYS